MESKKNTASKTKNPSSTDGSKATENVHSGKDVSETPSVHNPLASTTSPSGERLPLTGGLKIVGRPFISTSTPPMPVSTSRNSISSKNDAGNDVVRGSISSLSRISASTKKDKDNSDDDSDEEV